MFAVRYAALVALVLWVGGMCTLGLVVAPSTFRVLQAADPTNGRLLAGAVFGEVLRLFHYLSYACGAIVLVCLFMMKFIGPPPHAFVARSGIVVVMLLLAVYSGVPVTRELARVQAGVSGPVNRLPESDPRRIRFDRLHRTSTALMTVNIGLGLVLLFWYSRE
jgi:uncharacterized membrane protein